MRLIRGMFGFIFFIIFATLLIPGILGVFITFSFFKVILIILLIGLLIKNILRVNLLGIGFSIILLGILCAVPLGALALLSWKMIIVALFIGIGLSLIFKNKKNYIDIK